MVAADGSPQRAARPIRADAQRNRDAILAAAREVFESEGVMAPLDGIAVRAGVGNATLYRNFPTRNDLLAAVMAVNIDVALSEGDALLATSGPREALAEWLFRLTWQLRIWHDLPYCISAARADPSSSVSSANDLMIEKTGVLLDAAIRAGVATATVAPEELFELVTTLSWGLDRFGHDEATARRRVAFATASVFIATNAD